MGSLDVFTNIPLKETIEICTNELIEESETVESLTHQTPKLPTYRNQLIDLQSKSIDWFLCDSNFGF